MGSHGAYLFGSIWRGSVWGPFRASPVGLLPQALYLIDKFTWGHFSAVLAIPLKRRRGRLAPRRSCLLISFPLGGLKSFTAFQPYGLVVILLFPT